MKTLSIGICIITHDAKHHLPFCLPFYLQSKLKPKILIVNSSSHDGTVELAQEYGVDVLVIPRNEFNHGVTREIARRSLGTDIIIMATPDAYPTDAEILEKLIEPLIQGKAVLSYGRQIPHKKADFWESFPRHYNYPAESHIRSLTDIHQYGVYTFFFSDSLGAYLNSALDEVGGFKEILTGEDTMMCAKLLQRGYRVAYVAEATIHHSHGYTLKQEFKRHFDTGLARETIQNLIGVAGQDSKRGKAYVGSLFYEIKKQKNYHLYPYAFLQSVVKYLGYWVGRKSKRAPSFFKKSLSSQDFYWNSVHKSL